MVCTHLHKAIYKKEVTDSNCTHQKSMCVYLYFSFVFELLAGVNKRLSHWFPFLQEKTLGLGISLCPFYQLTLFTMSMSLFVCNEIRKSQPFWYQDPFILLTILRISKIFCLCGLCLLIFTELEIKREYSKCLLKYW